MTYKYLPERLRGLDFDKISEQTGLEPSALREIAGIAKKTKPARAATAGEAVKLGKFLDMDPVKILHKQIEEELAAAGYEAKTKAPGPTREGAKSPADPKPQRTPRAGSSRW